MTVHVPHNYHALPGSERHKAPGARRINRDDPEETVRVLIRVRRPPGAAPAPDHSHWERTKPGHRKFLSRKELAEKYGAAAADLEHVAAFARSKDLKVLELHAARRLVIVSGTVQQLNHAFAVDLGHYETDDEEQKTYRGREGPIYVPKDIHHLIEGVFGLDNRRMAHRRTSKPAPGGTNSGPNSQPLTPIDIANLYNFPPIPANISDQTIGVLEFGGGLITNSTTGRPTDIDSFINQANASYSPALTLSLVNVTTVILPGGSNTLAGSLAKPNSVDGEVALDIDVTGSVANGSPIACYFAPWSQAGWLETILAAIFPDGGQPAPSVLSNSWFSDEDGWSASTLQTVSGIFQQAAEAGITIFSASGDQGTNGANAFDGKAHVLYPSSDPWVTACGGTQISNITWTNSTTASVFTENTWNQGTPPGGTTAAISGGGISTSKDSSGNLIFPVPSWQQGFNLPPSINDNTTKGRGIPDIAGYAEGYSTFVYGGGFSQAGTSEAAPLYAALIARINATLGFNVGYLNPTFYSLAFSSSLFRDIADGTSNAFTYQVPKSSPPVLQTSPGYTSVTGWDACTGLGVLDGTKLIGALAGGAISPSFYFSVSKNTFGTQEVNQTLSWPGAFSLILDGVAPAQVMRNPVFTGPFASSIPGLTISPSSTTPWPAQELGGSDNALQRITFSYDIIFSSNSVASFPSIGNTSTLSLTASMETSVAGYGFPSATAQFELVAGADPFFVNVSQQFQNPFWLSQDLRVFTLVPGIDTSPVAGKGNYPTWQPTISSTSNHDTQAAFNYVQGLINYLNGNYSDPTQADPFTTLLPLTGGLTGDSSVFPYTENPNNTSQTWLNYNFAIARVRLSGGVGAIANNVNVFFRLFLTASNDTDYQPSTTYATGAQGGVAITPKVANESDPLTIPFFATGNYEDNADHAVETDYASNGYNNNRNVQILAGSGVWAYFGCYLNVYNANNTIGGKSIVLTGTHHCLIAEISYSGTPITTGTSASNSSQLAQRNLQINQSDNPGPPSTHRVPQTFDLRPSAPFNLDNASDLLNWPDEIMIDWGNVPAGSRATVYWPQVSATDVITLASRLYPTHELTAPDAHTLSIPNVGHVKQSYIPVPSSTSAQNFAGMLTIDLPQTVVTGQEFTAVVKRLTTKQAAAVAPPPPVSPVPQIAFAKGGASTEINNWRYITGSFAVTIPVSTPADMLPAERDILAIFKWRLSQTPTTNRWYPVLQRYISYVEGRVSGLGGNPITVLPSPYGAPPAKSVPIGPIIPIVPIGGTHGHHHHHHHHEGHTGKIEGLIYDRFGDFDGFIFSGEDGHEHRFHSRSTRIEDLVRLAWREQMVVTVLGEQIDPAKPTEIVLRRWPRV